MGFRAVSASDTVRKIFPDVSESPSIPPPPPENHPISPKGHLKAFAFRPSVKRWEATSPLVSQTEVTALATQLEQMAKKGWNDLGEMLVQKSPVLVARALLAIPNDARVAQILIFLENKIELPPILAAMDLWDTSMQNNDTNRRDAIEELLKAPMFTTESADFEKKAPLKSAALRVLANHVDRFGWSLKTNHFMKHYNGIEVTGLATYINEAGEERPITIFFRLSGPRDETQGEVELRELVEAFGPAQATYHFPDDPIGRDLFLQEYKGTISQGGKADLAARRQFPSNIRGRELVKVEMLSTLTEEEKEELHQLRNKKLEAQAEKGSSFSRNRSGFDFPR